MSLLRHLPRIAALLVAVLTAGVALTWALDHVIPWPYSNYLAVIMVGLIATEIFKRQPRQRALRAFRIYLHVRARGADESAARERLLSRLYRDQEVRRKVAREIEPRWTGPSEKERVVGGVAALLEREGRRLAPDELPRAYDRERDRFSIPGWEALPSEFVDAVRGPLTDHEWQQLQGLVERYALFKQKFFRSPTSLAQEPAAGVTDFARLLHSMGNHLGKDEPGDGERAYRVSLRLRPQDNLAHAGLALLLERTGRTREAAREAGVALDVLDAYARRAADSVPTAEDIWPFKSPEALRKELQRAAGTEPR